MSDLLLDTCAVLWLANGTEMTPEARTALENRNIHVSPISAWEIANLVRKNRIAISLPVARWFRQVTGKVSAAMVASGWPYGPSRRNGQGSNHASACYPGRCSHQPPKTYDPFSES